MVVKFFAILFPIGILITVFFGVRAQLKPWESRRIPWLVVTVIGAVFLALLLVKLWAVGNPPRGGTENHLCEGLSCPPERPEQL